jgi:hypothetical protein
MNVAKMVRDGNVLTMGVLIRVDKKVVWCSQNMVLQ